MLHLRIRGSWYKNCMNEQKNETTTLPPNTQRGAEDECRIKSSSRSNLANQDDNNQTPKKAQKTPSTLSLKRPMTQQSKTTLLPHPQDQQVRAVSPISMLLDLWKKSNASTNANPLAVKKMIERYYDKTPQPVAHEKSEVTSRVLVREQIRLNQTPKFDNTNL